MTATVTPGTSDDEFAARPMGDVDDVDHIMSAYDDDGWADDVGRAVELNADALFTWDYERTRPALSKLYEKAKTSQWNGATDLDWSIDVDPEHVAENLMKFSMERFKMLQGVSGSPFKNFGLNEWTQVGVEMQRFQLSQFLHGEQGALMVAGYVTATTPWIDAKYYAATQTVDEARHVEVFARYLHEKLGGDYPMNPNLGALITDTLSDSRWDLTYLGMQIMVEGLALAAFGAMHHTTSEPLLKRLLRYVMSDEARHVAFGVLTLREYYEGLSDAELRERQEFTFESAERLRNRFFMVDVWERMGVDPRAVLKLMAEHPPPAQTMFQQLLFSKIVPNTKKLGLLDASGGWLRRRFEELGVIEFEDWVDTSEEYANLDAFEADAKAEAG
ncbi:ferritin-like domain-containing protein [Candidatus Microthrix sp.]|uniref:ferritin-like domain-containing protein n=1 Tax=Candidatus Neomicrothrix sp. TaxID=2719034 RepID=UPI00259ACD2A|nr:ferritin-like domain-containing protein [Candidatus Microthrix sp.]HMS48664.1 ferritin-like domain-containing protein [Candidatus Microthrix sp.]